MKKYFSRSFVPALAIGCLIGLASCKDDDHEVTPAPEPAAVITIERPVYNQVCHTGDSLHMTGHLVTQEALHGYSIIIRKKPENTIVYSYNGHDHGTHVTFDQKWHNTIADSCDLEMEVTAILDHDGNTAGKRVKFKCLP